MGEWKIKTLKESFEHTTPSVRKALEKGEFKGQPAYFLLEEAIGMKADRIAEHLSLVADTTPKEVKKAVDERKLAMRSASMICQRCMHLLRLKKRVSLQEKL